MSTFVTHRQNQWDRHNDLLNSFSVTHGQRRGDKHTD